MTPLKVTFELCTPMVFGGNPIHLDALAAYAMTQRELPFLEDPQESDYAKIYEDLPFDKHHQEGDWVFKASALIPLDSPMAHSSRFYTLRNNEMELAEKAGAGIIQYGKMKSGKELAPHALKLDMIRGAQRNLLAYYPTTEVSKMVAYCVADEEQLQEILIDYGYIKHIGSRRRSGNGALQSITIEKCEASEVLWVNRVKPWPLVDDDVQVSGATKAPYWSPENRQIAYCPVDVV